MARVTTDTVMHLQDFGLERLDEDRAIVGFANKAEARLVRWLDLAKGALLFLMVPGRQRIRNILCLRPRPLVLLSALAPDRAPLRRFSGREEFEFLTKAFDLVALARNPGNLRA